MTRASVPQRVITSEAANAAVTAAVAAAARLGIKVNVAVVDPGGTLCAFLRMPGAFLESVGIAIDKARTSAGFGIPSAMLYGILKDNRALELGIGTRQGLAIYGGGLPLMDGDERIGGIGVSGGSEAQDLECAEAGIAAIAAMARAT